MGLGRGRSAAAPVAGRCFDVSLLSVRAWDEGLIACSLFYGEAYTAFGLSRGPDDRPPLLARAFP